MPEEYYKEKRSYFSWILVVMGVLITMLMVGAAAFLYKEAAAAGDVPQDIQSFVGFTAFMICVVWILVGSGFYLEYRSHKKDDDIPLTRENIVVESRSIDGGYNMISKKGIAYVVLDEAAFTKLSPGTTVTCMIKYYPKEGNYQRRPMLVRTE